MSATIDRRISADLAVVSRASRERPIALAATLRAVGAVAAIRAPSSGREVTREDVVLVSIARIFAARVARIATACAVTLFVFARIFDVQLEVTGRRTDLAFDVLWMQATPLRIAAACALIYIVASRIAFGVFHARMSRAQDPHVRARSLAVGVDRLSLSLWIGGAAMFSIAELARIVLFNGGELIFFQVDHQYDWYGWTSLDVSKLLTPIVLPMAICWIAAPLISSRYSDRTPRGWLALIPALVMVSVLALGGRIDPDHPLPVGASFVVAMIFGSVALVMHALARRANEQATIDGKVTR